MTKKATTNYLEDEPYQKLKELLRTRFGKPISQELDELIKKRLAELEGQDTLIVDQKAYADLKRQYNKFLSDDGDAIKKRLERLEVYDQLD